MSASQLLSLLLFFFFIGTFFSFLAFLLAVKIFRVKDAGFFKIVKIFLLLALVGFLFIVTQAISTVLYLLLIPLVIYLNIIILKRGFQITWGRSIGIYLVNLGLAVVLSAIPAMAIRGYYIQAFKIPSGAMLPTLLVGDYLLANKSIYRSRQPARGEIIIFKFPQDRETDFIKRVVALPGEEISISEGRPSINGEELAESYAFYEKNPGRRQTRDMGPFLVPAKGDVIPLDSDGAEFYRNLVANELGDRVKFTGLLIHIDGKKATTYQVQKDYLFVMGDNRDNSYDSRFWGPVSVDDVIGRAEIIYWSYDKAPSNIRKNRIGKSLVE